MSLITAVSSWFLLLCLLVGAAYALLVYYKSSQNLSKAWLKYPLATMRGLAVALIVLLLFNPYFKREKLVTTQPLVVFAFDNSSSVAHKADSSSLANSLQSLFQAAEKRLNESHNLRFLSFDAKLNDSLKFDFKGQATDLSNLFQTIETRYAGQQLAALVLVSDGIYNRGYSPEYLAEKLGVPIYTIPLGDTSIRRDLRIKQLRANQVVYINSDFSIMVDVEANRLNGKRATVRLEKLTGNARRLLQEQSLNINSDRFFSTMSFVTSAESVGIHQYRVSISSGDEDENMATNNVRDIFVQVVDSRTKVLLLAHGAHPDLSALRTALQLNSQFEVTTKMAWEPVQMEADIDLVILHQLPSLAPNAALWMRAVQQLNQPIWYILGSQSHLPSFNQAQSMLSITTRSGGINKTLPALNPAFRLFTLDAALQEQLATLPPLDAPFGSYQLSPQATPLLYQQIGNLSSDMPLWAFRINQEPRMGILAAEGLWRWRLALAERQTNLDVGSELIRKSVQLLTANADKKPFMVRTNRNLYQEQDEILFEATLYNQSFEPVNEPDVQLLVKEENSAREFSYTFGRSRQNYNLNAGALPAGNYTYTANTKLGDALYQANGSFAVSTTNLEKTNTVANHSLLEAMAVRTAGQMIDIQQSEALLEALEQHETIRPISFLESKLQELISMSWLLTVILLLLGAEWLLRRYAGSY